MLPALPSTYFYVSAEKASNMKKTCYNGLPHFDSQTSTGGGARLHLILFTTVVNSLINLLLLDLESLHDGALQVDSGKVD